MPTVKTTLMDVPILCASREWSVRMCPPQGWGPPVDHVLMVTVEMEQNVQVGVNYDYAIIYRRARFCSNVVSYNAFGPFFNLITS